MIALTIEIWITKHEHCRYLMLVKVGTEENCRVDGWRQMCDG